MRILLVAAATITVFGCTTTPPEDPGSALPPAVPVSDPVYPTQAQIYGQLGIRVRTEESPYVVLDKEPASRLLSPHASVSIVPVARIHERLNRMQIESLAAEEPIVRYEVIDVAFNTVGHMYQFTEADDNGLRVLALVYTAKLTKDSVPLSSMRMVRDLEVGGRSEMAKIGSLAVTLYEFELEPVGVHRASSGRVTTVDIATKDWQVVSVKRKASADASGLIDKLPVNDPSALALVR